MLMNSSVVDKASSIMLEKARADYVTAPQAYTLLGRWMTKMDIEQYKMQNVKDDPIESSQR